MDSHHAGGSAALRPSLLAFPSLGLIRNSFFERILDFPQIPLLDSPRFPRVFIRRSFPIHISGLSMARPESISPAETGRFSI
jgi:hypothetical protein